MPKGEKSAKRREKCSVHSASAPSDWALWGCSKQGTAVNSQSLRNFPGWFPCSEEGTGTEPVLVEATESCEVTVDLGNVSTRSGLQHFHETPKSLQNFPFEVFHKVNDKSTLLLGFDLPNGLSQQKGGRR